MRPRQQSPATLLARIRDRDFTSRSDAELRDAFKRLQSRPADVAAEALLPECFAIVAEAIDRRLGVWRLFDGDSGNGETGDGEINGAITQALADVARQRTYRRPGDILLPAEFYRAARRQDQDGRLRFRATGEQLLAGIHLFRGKVVQMDAGEGKTVAAAFPAALHALMGRPVHVATANDYLADRDARLLEPVYQSLGISAGAVLQHSEEEVRRRVYHWGIVYGAMRELGFDFLRDNLKPDPAGRVQRSPGLSEAAIIVDEADHALIDEAFTPMIISGNPAGSSRAAIRADRAVAEMARAQHGLSQQLAAGLENPGSKPSRQAQQLARLLLADPDSPALRVIAPPPSSPDSPGPERLFAANHRSLKRAWAMAEQRDAELTSGLYYAIHPGNRFVTLTEMGRDFLEQRLGPFYGGDSGSAGGDPPPEGRGLPLTESRRRSGSAARALSRRFALGNQALQSLRARLLLKRGVDYLVDGGAVTLIDQQTGRPKPGNIYQHGLQAAVEAKEGVTVHPESETMAWISVSGFVSLYGQVSGITGTAVPAAGEFRRRYGLEVAVVPPVNPPKRTHWPPKVFLTLQDKLAAVAGEVASRHRMGQPVLAAARTVEQSEELSRELSRRGIPHQLLNAVSTRAEARIVRDAGRFGAVTVSTPMAGRGTDIVLEPGLTARLTQRCAGEVRRMLSWEADAVDVASPSPEQAAVLRTELERFGQLQVADGLDGGLRVTMNGSGQLENRTDSSFPRKRESRARNKPRKLEFSLGLCVIGTEIYDSRRVELQLRGRSGRQGEFGLVQSFLSLEDRLVSLDADGILRAASKGKGGSQADAAGRVCFSGPEVARRIERLQAAADREGEAQRSLMQDYAAEFDRQTNLYYRRRQDVITGAAGGSSSMPDMCRETAQRVASRLASGFLSQDADDDYPRRFRRLAEEARLDYGVDCSSLYGTDLTLLPAELAELFIAQVERQASQAGAGRFPRLARLLWLQVCGELWPGHIAGLRDSMSSQLLSHLGHKSAVAQHIRRSNEAWREYWELVDAEFLSRLTAFPLSLPPDEPPVTVSRETELLLGQAQSSSLAGSPPGLY